MPLLKLVAQSHWPDEPLSRNQDADPS